MVSHLLDGRCFVIVKTVALTKDLNLAHEDTGVSVKSCESYDEVFVDGNNLFRRIHLKFVGHFFFRHHQDRLLVLKCKG